MTRPPKRFSPPRAKTTPCVALIAPLTRFRGARGKSGAARRRAGLSNAAAEQIRDRGSAVIARAKLDLFTSRATNRHTATLLEAHLEGAA